MNREQFKEYCLNKKGVIEAFPFDDKTLVFKVGSKMFALTNISNEKFTINLKCDPEMAEDLRREYPFIIPGFHMNKRHWNTVEVDDSVNNEFLKYLIDESYELVFKSLKKLEREEILKQK